MQKITPFLWFDKDAKAAAEFYVSVFGEDSKIRNEQIMPPAPTGDRVEVMNITLRGQDFTLMAAGPYFKFNESVSFVIDCKDQEEVDYFWNALTADGGQESMCGWLKDKYGMSWQVTPRRLIELTTSSDREKAGRATAAMLTMKKIDIAAIEAAYEGK
ncbi:MAG TPA: VOC family protein [Candidatus Paceibacterota bacterium]|nr:VOC family protein [Candidatus Paceibacterota bacterium]